MSQLIDTTKHEKIQKKASRRRERELSDLRFMLLSKEGRRLVWRWIGKGRIFQEPFCNDNTNGTNYNLGRMSLSRDLLNDVMEAAPHVFNQMQQEAAAQEQNDLNEDVVDRKLEEHGGFGLTESES